MSMLEECMMKAQSASDNAGQQGVKAAADKRKIDFQQQQAALQKEEDDAKKGGFLDDLTNNTGLMSAIGLATFCPELVAADLILHATNATNTFHLDAEDNLLLTGVLTGGTSIVAATALTGEVLRKASFVNDAAHSIGLGGLSDFADADHIKISDADVHPYLQYLWAADLAAISIAGTAATFGAGTPLALAIVSVALSGAAIAVEKTKCMDKVTGAGSSEYWALGLDLGSLYFGIGTSLATAGKVASGATAAATALNGASAVAKGANQIQLAVQQHTTDEDDIAAKAALFQAQKMDRFVSVLMDGLKETTKSHQSAIESLSSAIQTNDQTLLTASTMKV